MKKNTEISARIAQIIENQGITSNLFAKKLGYDRSQTVYDIINSKSAPSYDFFRRFEISEYSEIINISWLFTGQGEMLKTNCAKTQNQPSETSNENTDSQHKYNDNSQIIKEKSRKLIPFYDMDAEAGTIRVSNMEDGNEPEEYIDAGDWFLDADSAMRVHGDSMFPEYKSGSIVVMREVFDKRLVVYGEDYMVQTCEYRVIKRLYKGNTESHWLACSVNEETWEKGLMAGRLIYEPFEIFIDDVIKLCRVIGCVKRTESSRIVYNQNKKL